MSGLKPPAGHHTITPGMVVPGVSRLIDFLKAAFGAEEVERYEAPDGTVAHAEVRIGDSSLMMGEPFAGFAPMPCMLTLYVDDVDATFKRAVEAGAQSLEEPKNQPYGYRTARVRDPSGNRWSISQVIEELTREEIERRMADMLKGG